MVAVLLKMIHFSYTEEVAASRVIQVLGVLLLYYLKIWDFYSGLLYMLSIFALMMVCLYVYDCCGNMSHYLNSWKEQHRDLALLLSFGAMLATTGYVGCQIYRNSEDPLFYQYSGIYLLQILLMVLGNLVRRRSIIYSLLGVLVINYLIAMRHLLHSQLHSPSLITMAKLPLEYIPYFLMALDAEKREREAMQAQTYKSLFKTCAYLAAYSLLNDSQFPLELLLGGVFIFGLLVGK